jgi:hypothetical protein
MGMDAYRTGQALSNMPGLGAPAGLLKAAANAPDVAAMLGGLLGKAGVGKLLDRAKDASDLPAGPYIEVPTATTGKPLQRSDGVSMSSDSAYANALRKGKQLIDDWKWRDMKEVSADLQGMNRVQPYITDTYGRFMVDQSDKAKAGNMGPRDVIKAYGITRSSVNRGARNMSDDVYSAADPARPEGYMAEWLLTKDGQKYLNAAERGVVDESSIADIVRRFKPFGMADTLGKDLRYIAQEAPNLITPPVHGSQQDWRNYSRNFAGLGPSKSGFFASLLGRGDLPTFDARQINLHTGAGGKDAAKYISRGDGLGGDQAVDRLAQRQTQMALALPRELSPYYQHLTHHQVWDQTAGSKTTHEDIVRAMQRGRADPRLLALIAAGTGGGLLGYNYLNSGQPK